MISNPARDAGEKPATGKGILEQHYTPPQLAKAWGLSASTVRTLFRDEPGLLEIDRREKLHKRGYKSIRIPASVAERVYRRMMAR